MRKRFLKLLVTAGLVTVCSLGLGMNVNAGGAFAKDSSGYDAETGSYYTYWWDAETESGQKTDWEWDYEYVGEGSSGTSYTILKNVKTGEQLKNGWFSVNEIDTYFDAAGHKVSGFIDGRESDDAGWEAGAKTVYNEDPTNIDWKDWIKLEKAKYGWITDDKGSRYGTTGYYYNEDGKIVKETVYLTGTPSYIEKDKSWAVITIDGKNYKFNADGYIAKNEWFDDGWMMREYADDGETVTKEEWQSNWKYATSDGSLAEGWTEIDGQWYYFESARNYNRMLTSQVVDGYYLDENGTITTNTGWFNNWYWIDKDKGEWQDNWLYIQDGGKVSTGWTEIDGTWYCFRDVKYSKGDMYTKTVVDGYYLTEDGTLATGGWYYNWYWTDEEKGEWDDEWIYTYSDGSVPSGWTEIDGTWYYFESGTDDWTSDDQTYTYWWSYMVTDGFVDGYYINSSGTIEDGITGAWYQDDKGWYFMDSNGWYPSDTSYIIDNKYYYFNEEGYMVDPPEENSTEGQG